jgi:hypothetical protein
VEVGERARGPLAMNWSSREHMGVLGLPARIQQQGWILRLVVRNWLHVVRSG